MGIIVALILALSAGKHGVIDPTEGLTKNQQTTVNARSGVIDPTEGIKQNTSTPVNAKSGVIDPTEG